jgi:hypothetical protein
MVKFCFAPAFFQFWGEKGKLFSICTNFAIGERRAL